jgi:hypothetical protein
MMPLLLLMINSNKNISMNSSLTVMLIMMDKLINVKCSNALSKLKMNGEKSNAQVMLMPTVKLHSIVSLVKELGLVPIFQLSPMPI